MLIGSNFIGRIQTGKMVKVNQCVTATETSLVIADSAVKSTTEEHDLKVKKELQKKNPGHER